MNVAAAVWLRFSRLGKNTDADEAIIYYREALTLIPLDHPRRPSFLSGFAAAVHARFTQFEEMEDLEEVVTLSQQALSLHPPDHPERPIYLYNLATAVHTRFRQLGRMKDLERAITHFREALTLRPPGDPHRSHSLDGLAKAIWDRFNQQGRMEDLEEALTLHREALALRPHGHPDYAHSLGNLANTLCTRFHQLGKMEDLEEALTYNREVLALHPVGHPDYSKCLTNLGSVLFTRFQQLGNIEDLESGITYYHKVLSLGPVGFLDHSGALNNLGNALHARFCQLGSVEDLEEEITLHREALALFPLDHPNRVNSLGTLGNALMARFSLLGGVEDLREAIAFYEEALALLPHDHPDVSNVFSNIARIACIFFNVLGDIESLEKGIDGFREALAFCPRDHPRYCGFLGNLSDAIFTRFEHSGKPEDLEEAFVLHDQAANHPTASSKDRLDVAIKWAYKARFYHHSSAMHAYSTAFHLLDRCLISRPDIESQQKFLATTHLSKTLAFDAASAAIDAQQVETAVEFLERGRALLWSKMNGYRRPLDALRLVDADLADRLLKLNTQLERLVLPSEFEVPNGPLTPSEFKLQRLRILSEEWEEVIKRVREVEGFSDFLQGAPFTTLQAAAAEGPVIVVNVSQFRSDAIILHINHPPILVPLPDLQLEDIASLVDQLASARNDAVGDPSKHIVPILRDLWDNVVSPVVDRLAKLGVPEKSRLWWCPTSMLCGLPLHASGPYQRNQRNLPDIYTSSYIPTVSALIRARSDTIGSSAELVPKLLVIGQPGESLPSVQEEIDGIQQLGDFVTVKLGEHADRDTVLDGLKQHSWVHFACHGHLGPNDQPFHASFELHGGSRLTLLDLIQARLPNAEFAFLSACHSATGEDLDTPDEAIHLAAALQFCGFRSVIGTLWAMDDKDGPTISKEFYNHIFRHPGRKVDSRDSAEALNLAVKAMRKRGVPLERWIMFVHTGA
ncbi:hypothetical protein K443DRAFT_330790 [Laccaria amethystina LaAM-08-1]|uniref:CHAT domain-containing protein n=1 Tax=Laccaria amethystina LaAM-08-1 TaxID=1095629 RepID=A0A0C9X272_9AGAR|nr:hypothetical protein K443DRAFT_330790 [Laccaria amethystina LaAM-08-1]